MRLRVEWLLVAVLACCLCAEACNVHEINEIIRSRLKHDVGNNCGTKGAKCVFDRDCCKGFECKMAISKMSIDSYCEETRSRTDSLETDPQGVEKSNSDNDPNRRDDGYWMLADSWPKHEDREPENIKNSELLNDIQNIQENKRLQLEEVNEKLERLFTEKDQHELEKLRAIKEEMELEELRTLKELKLKRKLRLLKELRELKEMKADEYLNVLNAQENKTKISNPEVLQTNSSEIKNIPNQTKLLVSPEEQETHTQVHSSTTEILESFAEKQKPELVQNSENLNKEQIASEKPSDKNSLSDKNKVGVHEHHHHKKHHQQKHKKKQTINSTFVGEQSSIYKGLNNLTSGNKSDIENSWQ